MKTILNIILYAITIPTLNAASVIINWSITTDPVRVLRNFSGTALSTGTAASGDGTLLQLGYYDMATITSPFTGSWIVLATSSMGDDGIGVAGRFSTTSTLVSGAFTAPTVNTPLAIRFYDGSSVGTSIFFNAVSATDGTWNFVNPTDPSPVLNLVIDKGFPIVFESGELGAFATKLVIPEPSHVILVLIGGVVSLSRRRRK
jgi:hypothetical protein